MNGDPTAILMAVSSTRRGMTEPPQPKRPRRARRTVALALQRAAHKLDAGVAPPPRVNLGRR
jgi:hypothetical protein